MRASRDRHNPVRLQYTEQSLAKAVAIDERVRAFLHNADATAADKDSKIVTDVMDAGAQACIEAISQAQVAWCVVGRT